MYPIQCPIIAPPSGLVHLGPAHTTLTACLNAFANQTTGMALPIVNLDWQTGSTEMSSANIADIPVWLRRLSDAGEMVSLYHGELKARVGRETTAATSKSSQLAIDVHQLNRVRLGELSTKMAQRKSSSGAVRSRWHLGLMPKDQGQIFLNEDGRAIHLRTVTGSYAVLGYGWHTEIMHYLSLGQQAGGFSIALFTATQAYPSDLTGPWFSSLVQSMMEFYAPSYQPPEAKISVAGTTIKRAPLNATGAWKDAAFLTRTFRDLSLSHDFTVSTEDLVDGSRNPSFASITPPVPQGQFHYSASGGRIVSSFYRSKKNPVIGERHLAAEQRERLIFPKSASRSPSRP